VEGPLLPAAEAETPFVVRQEVHQDPWCEGDHQEVLQQMSLAVRCSQDIQLVVAHMKVEGEDHLSRHPEEGQVGPMDPLVVQEDQAA